jgi:hypothetical protein
MAELPTGRAVNYLVLARGNSLGASRVLAVSADQALVNKFVAELVGNAGEAEDQSEPVECEPLRVVPSARDWPRLICATCPRCRLKIFQRNLEKNIER